MVVALIGINGLAIMHSRAMTTMVAQGEEQTRFPEDLYAKHIFIPTLLIHGKDNTRVTRHQADAIYQNLQGWKQYSEYSGSGHGSSYRQDPHQWREDVRSLLSDRSEMN